jgi:ABC-type uncharacterized transport system permease subunit
MKKPVQSLNTWTTVIGFIIAALFTSQGIEVNLSSDQIAEALMTKEGIGLILFLGMNLVTPVIKLVKRIKDQGGFDVKLLISRNLVAQLISVIAVIIASFYGEATAGFAIAMLTQAVNFFWHKIEPQTPQHISGIPPKE